MPEAAFPRKHDLHCGKEFDVVGCRVCAEIVEVEVAYQRKRLLLTVMSVIR